MSERTPKFSGARARGRRKVLWPSPGTRCACLLWTLTALLSLYAEPCHAQSNAKAECVAAYEQAQVSKQDGDLLKAEQELVSCAGVSCPEAMQADCSRWLEEVQAALPSVVLRVLTPTGTDIADARVALDGQPERPLAGRAIAVNPGKHQLLVLAPHFVPVTVQVQFVEGQKLRQEVVTLQPISHGAGPSGSAVTPGPRATTAQHRLTVVHWIGVGSAAAGVIGFTYFGVKARAGENNLDRCSPGCSRSAVDDVKRNYLAANLSLGLGLVGLAVATVQYFAQGSSAATNAAPKHQAKAGLGRLHVELSPSFAGWSGSF